MIRRLEVIGDYVGGVQVAPVPEQPTGGGLVKITAPGTVLDRAELEQLREVIDEALR